MITGYKLKQWQRELDSLVGDTGITYDDVCNYLGLSYNKNVGFYIKIPRKKKMFIGIGMAFKQPLDVINKWIVKYGDKKKLYCKDVAEDLVWIYLINVNVQDKTSDTNYYSLYEKCQSAAYNTYLGMWEEICEHKQETVDVESSLLRIGYDKEFAELRRFVSINMDAFKNAYSKPRKILEDYSDCYLKSLARVNGDAGSAPLSELRGWLDDSMINYLAGSHESINVNDRKSGCKSAEFKHVPKSRKAHIALCLALGMVRDEIDKYLDLMGFGMLDENDISDATLIDKLSKWDEKHVEQRKYKDKYFAGNGIVLTQAEENTAINDLLSLRQVLSEEYRKHKMIFPYIKD